MKSYLLNLLAKLATVYHAARRFFKHPANASKSLREASQISRENEKEVITMSSSLTADIKQRLVALARDQFNIDPGEIASEIPPRTELGDLAFPIAFDLAKRIKAATGEKKNPRELATKLAEVLAAMSGFARVEVAGAGYLNVFLDRAQIFAQLTNPQSQRPESQPGKLIVEHTAINPNKAAHIGHVRNAVLGDTTARILRAVGENVEVHNYIDNTGVQVADVVVPFSISKRSRSTRSKRWPKSQLRNAKRASITTVGTCTPASAPGTRKINRGLKFAQKRFTKSKKAATSQPMPPNTFHRRSLITIWTRCRV